MRRVVGEIRHQRLGEALHGELGGGVGGVGALRAQRGPEAVHAAGVHQVGLAAGGQHRHEGAGAVVHAEPADVEGALPLLAVAVHEAGAAADAGVVEQQIDVVRIVGALHGVAELLHGVLVRHVAVVGGDDAALRRLLLAQALGFRQVVVQHVAGGHVAALRHQLPAQRPAHARAAARYHGQLAAEILHCFTLVLVVLVPCGVFSDAEARP